LFDVKNFDSCKHQEQRDKNKIRRTSLQIAIEYLIKINEISKIYNMFIILLKKYLPADFSKSFSYGKIIIFVN